MHIPRIYQDVPLQAGTTIMLSSAAANHLINVLRLQINDQLILFNGQGGEFAAKIITISKSIVTVKLEQFLAKEVESSLQIHLGHGIARGEKMDYVIQKAVELGVQQITPLLTARCGVKLSGERWDKKVRHWRSIAIAACEQCGRNRLPDIFGPMPLLTWLTELTAELKFICQPEAKQGLSHYNKQHQNIAVLIGPESGLSESENGAALQQGFHPLKLGPRILRTETAALAAITAIQVAFGDMK